MQNDIYKKYWRHLYPIIYKMVRSSPMDAQNPYDPSEEAKDIVQNAIIKVFEKPPTATDEAAYLKYAETTAIRLFYAWRRNRFPGNDNAPESDPEMPIMPVRPGHRSDIFVADETSDDEPEVTASNTSDPHEDSTPKNDVWEMIHRCLAELPPKLRLVMIAYFWVVDRQHYKEGTNLNDAIVARIKQETGQTFTPGSIGVDRTRGIELLRQCIQRNYPNAAL